MVKTMKLLGSTENKVSKNQDGENVTHLEINKIILAHCDIVNNNYQFFVHFLQINHLINY